MKTMKWVKEGEAVPDDAKLVDKRFVPTAYLTPPHWEFLYEIPTEEDAGRRDSARGTKK